MIEKESPKIREVEVSREPLALFKIMKFEGMVGSGGEAKAAIAAGQVLVNGGVEIQKRKKIVSGDTIEFAQEIIRIRLSESGEAAAEEECRKTND